MNAYIIERTTDGGASEQYLKGTAWIDNRDEADRLPFADAEQLANDFQDHAAVRGNGYLFNVGEIEASAHVNLVPTWEAASHIYVMALENGTPEGIRSGRDGIRAMAKTLDALVKRVKVLEANQ